MRTFRRMRSPILLLAVLLVLAGCSSGSSSSAEDVADTADDDAAGAEEEPREATDVVVHDLPDSALLPEGIAVDKDTGLLYVTNTRDGAVHRLDPEAGEAELFLEGDEDGRTELVGTKVRGGRLYAAGRRSGSFFVHDVATGDLLGQFDAPPAERSLLNDVSFAQGAAFVTDSFRPTIFRLPLDGVDDGTAELEPWLDLDETPITYEDGFNLNGITASDDGTVLLTVQSNTGQLWRIDVAERSVEEIDLGGASLTTGDGLLLDGTRLVVVRNSPASVTWLEMADDLRSGEVVDQVTHPSFDLPTTVAEDGGRLFVVNSQLNGSLEDAERPFTVTELPFDP